MPIIHVHMLAGRPSATKELLIAELTRTAVSVLGVDAAAVRVLIQEFAPEHWGVAGRPKSDAAKER